MLQRVRSEWTRRAEREIRAPRGATRTSDSTRPAPAFKPSAGCWASGRSRISLTRLRLTERAVEAMLRDVRIRIGARSRAQIAAWAAEYLGP